MSNDEQPEEATGRFSKPTQEALETLRKMLALRDKNDNPHQAAIAAAKAEKIMFDLGISEQSLVKEQTIETITEKKLSSRGGQRYTWQEELLKGVCKTNFCMLYKYNDAGAHFGTEAVIVGQPQDVEVSRYLFDYLFHQIQKLGLRAFREAQRTGATDYKWSAPYMRDWAPGAVQGVVEVLEEQRRENEEAAPESSMALVVAKDAMAEDYIFLKRYGKTKSEKAAFDTACSVAHLDGTATAKHTEEDYEEDLSDTAFEALKHLYADLDIRKQFRYGWDNCVYWRTYRRQEAEKEAKIASGEIKRPRQHGGRRSYSYASDGPGRKVHETDHDARADGYRTGRKIAIRQGIDTTSSDDKSPRRIS